MSIVQLRPPTDADNYRVKTGRFGDRFYTDPLPADTDWPETSDDDVYPAVSTVKKATGQDWSRAMAKRLAKAPSQLVEIARLDSEFERKHRLNLLSDAGLDQASGRGTIVHAHAEAVLANRLPIYQMTDTVKPYIRTLEAFLAAYQPTLVAVEFVAIHRTLNIANVRRGNKFFGYGGTGDAVIEIDGKWYLVDWKSRAEDSDHKAYPEEGAQVSAYGRADYWIVHDPESIHGAKRIKPPELEGGLIVSIKPDSYECYPIDLDKGFDYWTDLHAWWQARRSETKAIGRKWAPRAVPSQLVTGEEPCQTNDPSVDTTNQDSTTESPTPTDAATAPSATATTPTAPPADTGSDAPAADPPTPASNRVRFDALPEVKKGWAREAFKRKGIKPNDPATAGEVSRIIGEMEQRPTLREMQETRAEQVTGYTQEMTEEFTAEQADPEKLLAMRLAAEGGEATDAMIGEARLMFDMMLTERGREWTGFRVQEANAADMPIQISKLRSAKRANLYLALCRWAAWRGDDLAIDETEGNIEFASMITEVAGPDTLRDLGHRLAELSAEDSAKLAQLITEVVESETGEQVATEPETQPETQPQ